MPRVGSSRISTIRFDKQPFAQRDLLLVAAAQVPDLLFNARRFDIERIFVFIGNFHFGIVVDNAPLGDFLQVGQGDILLHILDQDQAIAFSIFGDISNARIDRVLR